MAPEYKMLRVHKPAYEKIAAVAKADRRSIAQAAEIAFEKLHESFFSQSVPQSAPPAPVQSVVLPTD